MKKRYIALYGGTNLSENESKFVEYLARAILKYDDYTLVTGGFGYFDEEQKKKNKSVDRSAQRGAKKHLNKLDIPLETRLETWLPENTRDRPTVVRLRAGKVTELIGKTAQARRLALVRDVDCLITIKGEGNTELVLDLAFTNDKPAFPLPFIIGGDSDTYWKNNRKQICQWFRIPNNFANKLEKINLDSISSEESKEIAKKIISYIPYSLERKCLILMPFGKEFDGFYKQIQKLLKKQNVKAIRIDHTNDTGDIFETFLRHLDDCDGVIADITDRKPNVMYEIGHCHARKIKPFLINRKKTNSETHEKVPFYIRNQTIQDWNLETEDGRKQFEKRLNSFLAPVISKTFKEERRDENTDWIKDIEDTLSEKTK